MTKDSIGCELTPYSVVIDERGDIWCVESIQQGGGTATTVKCRNGEEYIYWEADRLKTVLNKGTL